MRTLKLLFLAAGLAGTAGCAVPADDSPPDGFTKLFNGHDLTGWKDDGSGHWRAENGMIVYDGGGWQPAPDTVFERNLRTEKEYGDFVLLIDWKIEKDGNSGIYLRGDLQVEIWDRTALVYSSPHGSGGIVGYNRKGHMPLRTVDRPLGEWNHFEIRVEDETVTVHLNDQLVIDRFTADFNRAKGPIVLQHHGWPLWFKNIYVKELDGH